jgi:hypothetical protein
LTVRGCTVDNNAAYNDPAFGLGGGGIFSDGYAGVLTISSSVFYANSPNNVQGFSPVAATPSANGELTA